MPVLSASPKRRSASVVNAPNRVPRERPPSLRPRAIARRRRTAAYHEAGHAVARIFVGASATTVEIGAAGGGFTHGILNRWPGRGADQMWTWLLVLFAGSYAEALASGRTVDNVLVDSGRLDLKEAAPAIRWLVKHGHTKDRMDTLIKLNFITSCFLALRWGAIERVASELMRSGRLSGRQLKRLARF